MKYNILKSISICLFIIATIIATKKAHAAPAMSLKVDGNFNDTAWQHGRAIEAFQTLKGETPKAATTGKVLTDANYLYLAFRCEEPQMDKLQAAPMPRDGALWTNDCIEVFVAPFKTQDIFYHLIVDANGAIFDALARDGKEDNRYDLAITTKTQKQKNGWTLEMAVPLSDLGLTQARPALMNFARERKPVSELTSWHGLFAKPDTWQQVKLTLNNQRTVDVQDWELGDGSPLYGDNTAKSTFVPNTASPLKVLLYADQRNKWVLKSNKEIQPSKKGTARGFVETIFSKKYLNSKIQVSLPYSLLPREQPKRIRLVIKNGNEAVFRVTYQLNLPEKALAARLQAPYYYSTENYGFVQLDNVISADSIKHASIRLIVKSPDGALQQTKKIYPLRPSMTVGFDTSSWRNGKGAVFAELLNNGKPLAHQRLVVTKNPGPFHEP